MKVLIVNGSSRVNSTTMQAIQGVPYPDTDKEKKVSTNFVR